MNLKRIGSILLTIIGLVLALWLAVSVLNANWDALPKLVVLALAAVIVGGVALLRRPLVTVIVLALLTVPIVVIANWDAVISAGDSVLKFLFYPEQRVTGEVIECQTNSACSTIHGFVFSFILLFGFITFFAYSTLIERRFIAWFQHRIGPNRVGPLGLLQPLADAIKLIFKEDIVPSGAYKFVWFIAPLIKVVPVLIVLAVIPLGPKLLIPWFDGNWYRIPLYLADPNVGVLWLLAITSIGTYGIVLAGWASNNKYAMLGGLRSTAQMISYELSLGLTMAVPIMIVGSMSLGDIINAQANPPILGWFVFQNPLAAAILMVALLAEVNRAPFDLPEAEQELTAGYMTEYSGMKFASFMMAEYLGMIAISLIVASLFLGGYHLVLVDSVPILGPLFLIGKVIVLVIGMVWVRATLPRIRYDRLMQFGWKILLPLSILSVAWTAVSLVIGDTFRSTVVYGIFAAVLFVVVVGGSLYFLTRAGRGQTEADEPDLADDPIVTGEQRGIGYALINVLGALLAGLFGLFDFITGIFERIGGKPAEDDKSITPSGGPSSPTQAKSGGD